MVRSFIFRSAPPFAECHASTIAELRDGSLLAAWFGGREEGSPDTNIWGSRYDGEGWSDPFLLAKEPVACWNPVLFAWPDGTLWLFYKVGENVSSWTGVYKVSEDDGRSWSAPNYLPAGLLGPSKNKPILSSTGELVCGTSAETYNAWTCWVEIVSEGGRRWTRYGPIQVPGEPHGVIQPTLWELEPGHLRVLMRSTAQIGAICCADSTDGGRTWGDARPTSLPNPNSGIDAVKLSDGRILLIYNHTLRSDPHNGRYRIHMNVSRDGGDTWGGPVLLEDGGIEYSYPAVIEASDGRVHVTYTWNRRNIRHLIFDRGEL